MKKAGKVYAKSEVISGYVATSDTLKADDELFSDADDDEFEFADESVPKLQLPKKKGHFDFKSVFGCHCHP